MINSEHSHKVSDKNTDVLTGQRTAESVKPTVGGNTGSIKARTVPSWMLNLSKENRPTVTVGNGDQENLHETEGSTW